jgi:hypothetical protein
VQVSQREDLSVESEEDEANVSPHNSQAATFDFVASLRRLFDPPISILDSV